MTSHGWATVLTWEDKSSMWTYNHVRPFTGLSLESGADSVTHFPVTTSFFSQQILLILIFAKCMQPYPLCWDSNAVFPLFCLCLCKMLISPRKTHITPLFLHLSWSYPGAFSYYYSVCACVFVCETACVCACVCVCVCLKRGRHREKTKRWIESTSLIGNVRKSTKANWREEEGALVINLLGGGSRQVSASTLALFTRRGLSETVKPAGSWL